MQLSTTIRSPGALALGVFFAAVTARTIFDDVWSGAPVTIAHVNSAAALVAAIASGHMAWPQIKSGRLFSALGLVAILAASTLYIVTSAGSRNAEVVSNKAAAIIKTNEERAALRVKVREAEADVDQAKGEYELAKAAAAKECGSGKRTKCEGRTETRDNAAKDLEKAESHASMTRGKLSLLGPEQLPNAGYKHAAKVAASLPYVTTPADAIEARLILWLPFALVLISEAGTLVFLGMGLGHRVEASQSAGQQMAQQSAQHATDAELAELRRKFFAADERLSVSEPRPNDKPTTSTVTSSQPANRIGRAEQVKTFCTLFREQNGREPTFSEVRDGLSLPAATASKYRRAALG